MTTPWARLFACIVFAQLFGSATNISSFAATAPSQSATARFALPSFSQVLATARVFPWSAPVVQIPATVIDNGVMKNVPYMSFRAADAYEINIYGDPLRPSGIEVGVYVDRSAKIESKQHCLTFIFTLLPELAAEEGTRGRKFSGDVVRIRNLTYEITPPEAPDAYGAWWISVYDEALLDRSRASDVEIASVSTPIAAARASSTSTPEEWSASDLGSSRRLAGSVETAASRVQPENTRIAPVGSVSVQSPSAVSSTTSRSSNYGGSSGYSGGRVYVKSYVRKDGTYVSSHSRRK